jgi:methylthioribose-1-phosphate isomerase
VNSTQVEKRPVRPIEWVGGLDGHVRLIEQTLLPNELRLIDCEHVEEIHDAIKRLAVRGAPAIGIAAAMGLVLGIRAVSGSDRKSLFSKIDEVSDYLAGTRPTAKNLFWALDRMRSRANSMPEADVGTIKDALLSEAIAIRDEDAKMCRAIGDAGASLIPENGGVLTHCNAGALATAEYGTALALMYSAHRDGRKFRVYADETRPLLQGARLTTWELQQAGIDVTLICDNMAGHAMKTGMIQVVVTGADRIAPNGDAANKIGTYSVAVLANAHGIPFYVAAPSTTYDWSIETGYDIPIEERSPEEIRNGFGTPTAPSDVPCFCPAFDVTPAELITGLVTEKGLITPVTRENIAATLG